MALFVSFCLAGIFAPMLVELENKIEQCIID
jgi:hypothetical protein